MASGTPADASPSLSNPHDGRAVHVRKATRPEPRQQKINGVLGLSPNPGGTHRVLV